MAESKKEFVQNWLTQAMKGEPEDQLLKQIADSTSDQKLDQDKLLKHLIKLTDELVKGVRNE